MDGVWFCNEQWWANPSKSPAAQGGQSYPGYVLLPFLRLDKPRGNRWGYLQRRRMVNNRHLPFPRFPNILIGNQSSHRTT